MCAASGRDSRAATAILAALAIFITFVVVEIHPWGSEPSRADNFEAYWHGVASASDFVSFWTGASLVRQGAGSSLYDMEKQHEFQVGLRKDRFTSPRLVDRLDPFHNPPPLALLFLPFTLLPLSWAFLTWTMASIGGFALALLAPLHKVVSMATPVALMIATGAVADSILWGQADWVFLLALSLGLLALGSDQPLKGGLLIGLLWLKPQYAVIFPMIFLMKRRWHELAGMVLTGVILAAASWFMVGSDGIARYISVLQSVGSYYPPSASFIFPELMVNWRALFVNTVPGLSEGAGSLLVSIAGGATLLASLAVWRGRWDPSSPRFALQMLVAVSAAIVAAPHSHLHGITLLFAPLSLAIARRSWDCLPISGGSLILALGFLLTWVGWLIVPLRWLLAPHLLVLMLFVTWSLSARGDRCRLGRW